MKSPSPEVLRWLVLVALGLLIEGTTLLEHVCPGFPH